jgi:cytochrome o ubiquinol oxidase subunit 3
MSDAKRHAGLNLGAAHPDTDDAADSAVFGFWVFLMSDAVVFALLFATYGVLLPGTAGGPAPGAASGFTLSGALLETLLLLASSFTFGMASLVLKHELRTRYLYLWVAITLLLGAAFLALEARDFAEMAARGAVPSRSGFLSAFFALVPMHGLHVAVGLVWILVMLVQIRVFGLDRPVKLNLLRLGLFWHFLDIVWVAIFSVVYLQGLIR